MTPGRAVIFDLDDTLYRVRRYSLSGFREVARALARRGYDPSLVFQTLHGAYRRGRGARAFQELEARIGTDHGVDLLDVYRGHAPALRLPRTTRRVLLALRPSWRLGVLTNGPPDQQRRKVAALGLEPCVDAVICAHEYSEQGKPDAVVFHAVLDALDVAPTRAVMVGDDAGRDVAGARAVGCATIRVRRSTCQVPPDADADAVVSSLDEVPPVAARLVAERCGHVL